jgi:cell division protein FtsB
LVRSFSSKEDDDFVGFPGGPSPDAVLPTRKGLNRFVWDLRGEAITGVPTVFIEGSYDGYRVAPGTYTFKLKSGIQTLTTKVNLLPHPQMTATPADYAAQEQLMKTICDEVTLIHKEVLQNRKIRNQLKETSSLLKDKPGADSISKKAGLLATDLQNWEDEIVQNKAKSNDDVINYVNKLTADYIFVKGEMDNNIPYVTDGQQHQFEVLHQKWIVLQAKENALKQQIKMLNDEIAKANFGRIIL